VLHPGAIGRTSALTAAKIASIEYLSNPCSMARQSYAIGGRETRLIATTPNALSLPDILRYSVDRWADGDDHVCSFNRDKRRQPPRSARVTRRADADLLPSRGWSKDHAHSPF
jgi:hypothetical protein